MRIGITGDIHGDYNLFKIKRAVKMGIECLIVTGDFSYIMDNSEIEKILQRKISKMPILILFCDGNHENHKMLSEYPESDWNGGRVHFIKDNIIHLKRGEIYNIYNKKFFVFGGAFSVDREFGTENKDWWKEEVPSEEEKKHGMNNLLKNNYNVDYIITHTCETKTLLKLSPFAEPDDLNNYFMFIKDRTEFNKWFFGHLHQDKEINEKEICLHHRIFEI